MMTLIRGLRGILLVPMASLTLLFVNGAYAQAILGFGFGETLWEHLWTIAAKTYFGRYLILAFFSSLITMILLEKFLFRVLGDIGVTYNLIEVPVKKKKEEQ